MDMLIFGLSVTVVGMLIVFFGLIILIGLYSAGHRDDQRRKAP